MIGLVAVLFVWKRDVSLSWLFVVSWLFVEVGVVDEFNVLKSHASFINWLMSFVHCATLGRR